MSLWDNITQKAAAVTDKAVHQAKNFTEQVKLRNQISEAQSTITDCYTRSASSTPLPTPRTLTRPTPP